MKSLSIIFGLMFLSMLAMAQNSKPFRIAIDGLTHDHVNGILSRADDGDIEIVGIAESNRELAERYLKKFNLPQSLLFPTLKALLEKTQPEAVAAFNSIYEHLETVRQCAPRKIHVMVEKPLAMSLEHAREMEQLAKANGIFLLTNYETTWYGSNAKVQELKPSLGDYRKIVVHDGHQGPKEIGVTKEFLSWLTDPKLNGGGAVIDFGCYGANLITWLMEGQRPQKVSAVLQQIKPDVYPNVDDEATIILTYPKAQGVIQASWNWTFGRKDMEVYGTKGYVIADRNGTTSRLTEKSAEEFTESPPPSAPFHNPFAYFAAVVHGQVKLKPTDLSSLENNMIVVEILDAAKRSAKEGRVITLN